MEFMELLKKLGLAYNIDKVNEMYDNIEDSFEQGVISDEQYEVLLSVTSKVRKGCF